MSSLLKLELFLGAGLLCVFFSLRAAPSDELRQVNQALQTLQKNETATKESISEAEGTIKQHQQRISSLYTKASALDSQIQKQQKTLNALQGKEQSAREDLSSVQAELKKVASATTILSLRSSRMPPFFFHSSLADDYLYRSLVLSEAQAIDKLKSSLETYRLAKKKVASQQDEIRQTSKKVNQNLSDLKSAQKQQESALSNLKTKLNSIHAKKLQMEAEAKRLKAVLEEIRRRVGSESYDFHGKNFSVTRGRLPLPLPGKLLKPFGFRLDPELPPLKGWIVEASRGSLIRAVFDGVVAYADYLSGFGYLVIVQHGGGYMTLYGFNDSVTVQKGQSVSSGDVLAYSGRSLDFGDSLYFGIRKGKEDLNPQSWVRRH